MTKRWIVLSTAALLFGGASASGTGLVANGSFETATFAPWTNTIVGTPFIPWLISPVGAGAGFSMAPTLPQDGTLDAWNGFDGSAGAVYTLHQDITIPPFLTAAALLKWKDRVQWNFLLTSTATQARLYNVQIRDTSGAVLATIHSFSTGTAHTVGDTGWQAHSVDVSAYAGKTIRLWFQENIPENFTGPGQFELDAVSLNVTELVSVDNCSTGILDRVVNPVTGGTLQQFVTSLVDSCTADARNHGDIVNCVTRGLNDAKGTVVNGQEKGAITACTAQTARRGKY